MLSILMCQKSLMCLKKKKQPNGSVAEVVVACARKLYLLSQCHAQGVSVLRLVQFMIM